MKSIGHTDMEREYDEIPNNFNVAKPTCDEESLKEEIRKYLDRHKL
jgi:hypothetical protein